MSFPKKASEVESNPNNDIGIDVVPGIFLADSPLQISQYLGVLFEIFNVLSILLAVSGRLTTARVPSFHDNPSSLRTRIKTAPWPLACRASRFFGSRHIPQ